MYIPIQLYSNHVYMYLYLLVIVSDTIEDITSLLATTYELTGTDVGTAIAPQTSDPLMSLLPTAAIERVETKREELEASLVTLLIDI